MEGAGLGYEMVVVSDATFRPINSPALKQLEDWADIVTTEHALRLFEKHSRMANRQRAVPVARSER